jgi:acyl carrier protein
MPVPDDVHDRVASIVADVFGIARDEVYAELGYGVIERWDSVGHLDLLMALERAFGFSLTADLIPQLASVRAIEEYVASLTPA